MKFLFVGKQKKTVLSKNLAFYPVEMERKITSATERSIITVNASLRVVGALFSQVGQTFLKKKQTKTEKKSLASRIFNT